jgi:hypothetical protein
MLQQQPLRLRPLDRVKRVFALVAGGAEQLDVPPIVCTTEGDRHDVVFVVSGLDRRTAKWVGATPPLHPADVLDVSESVGAGSTTLSCLPVALADTTLLGVSLRPSAGSRIKPFLVRLSVLTAALPHLGTVRLGVGLHLGDVLRALHQISRTASRHMVWPNASPVTCDARLIANVSTIDVSTLARFSREVMAKAKRLRLLSSDDLHFGAVRA